MDSSFFQLKIWAAAIGFFTVFGTLLFMVYKKFRSNPQNESSLPSSPPSSSLPSSPSRLSFPPSSSSPNWKYDVFSSFRGEDVRGSFLSRIMKEFKRKGIKLFIDSEVRGMSIGTGPLEALRGSRIAIVMLSRNYASSRWCLDELVLIMECRKELGQVVVPLFYELDPIDVRKQTGDFGKLFNKTCARSTKEQIMRWRHALAEVATISGFHSRNWKDEAALIEKVANDILNILNNATPSLDFEGLDWDEDEDNMVEESTSDVYDGLVGMEDHIEKLVQMLCLGSDEVRMIGISGPLGIGKTTIAECIYEQVSHQFQFSTIMTNIKGCYASNFHDEHNAKLQLQNQLLSQLSNQGADEIFHLGIAEEMLKDKKVLVVLDDVDEFRQLDALEEKIRGFGPGSRIIITTQDPRLLKGYGIEIDHIYKVDYPLPDQALQIFCLYAFGQKSPHDGFVNLAHDVTALSGKLPLGQRLMGTYLKGKSEQEWTNELPRLRTSVDGEVRSILKFTYESLTSEDKKLSHRIAASFSNGNCNETLEEYLRKSFSDVRQELLITNHDLNELYTSERVSEGISNGVLHWERCPFTCWPSTLYLECIDELSMPYSKLEKLWEGIRPLRKLRVMDFSSSENLKQLPDLSTATNLQELCLRCCSNLVELPSSIGKATSLLVLNLEYCSSLVYLPLSIGNATKLKNLCLAGCSSLVGLPYTIGNATNLQKLNLEYCSSLVKLPSSIGNAINLKELYLTGCSRLAELPESIGNATSLEILDLRNCSSLMELPSSIGEVNRLRYLYLGNCSSLVELPYSIGYDTGLWELDLSNCSSLKELPSSIGNAAQLSKLDLSNCSSLVELPFSIGYATKLQYLYLSNCSSLVNLPASIGYATSLEHLYLNNCSNLREVPSSLGNAVNLKKLDFSWCTSLVMLPDSIRNSTSLWQLDLDHCSSLLEVPSSNGNGVRIKKLDLSW